MLTSMNGWKFNKTRELEPTGRKRGNGEELVMPGFHKPGIGGGGGRAQKKSDFKAPYPWTCQLGRLGLQFF